MSHHPSPLSTLASALPQDPGLAHEELFRRLLLAELQDLIDARASVTIGADRRRVADLLTTGAPGHQDCTVHDSSRARDESWTGKT